MNEPEVKLVWESYVLLYHRLPACLCVIMRGDTLLPSQSKQRLFEGLVKSLYRLIHHTYTHTHTPDRQRKCTANKLMIGWWILSLCLKKSYLISQRAVFLPTNLQKSQLCEKRSISMECVWSDSDRFIVPTFCLLGRSVWLFTFQAARFWRCALHRSLIEHWFDFGGFYCLHFNRTVQSNLDLCAGAGDVAG